MFYFFFDIQTENVFYLYLNAWFFSLELLIGKQRDICIEIRHKAQTQGEIKKVKLDADTLYVQECLRRGFMRRTYNEYLLRSSRFRVYIFLYRPFRMSISKADLWTEFYNSLLSRKFRPDNKTYLHPYVYEE